MIDKSKIEILVSEYISDKEIFLVDTKVSAGNKITVLINKKSGLSIQECANISKHIESNLNRELVDFELQVSSPGLGEPFKVSEQYEMNVGHAIEVVNMEGRKINGLLKEFSGSSLILETTKKHKGKKKEPVCTNFEIDEVRTVKARISFNNKDFAK